MSQARVSPWARIVSLAGIGLAGVLLLPMDGRADVGSGRSAGYHAEQKRDVASRTFRRLLYDRRDLNLSAEQVGKLEGLAADYARAKIRNRASVELAEVDVKALMRNPQSELSVIETALRKSEVASTTERLDRVKAVRTALALLTPDQRDTWRARMRDRHRDGHRGPACGNVPAHQRHAFSYHDDIGETVMSREAIPRSGDGTIASAEFE
ncbi:MAG: hypothetical protein QM706_13865 [Nitrospira sp.]